MRSHKEHADGKDISMQSCVGGMVIIHSDSHASLPRELAVDLYARHDCY